MDGGEDPGVLREDPELAVEDYLQRPFDHDDLRRRLDTIHHRRHGQG